MFFLPLLEEFRWSRAATAGAMSVSTVVQGVLAPVVGSTVDRFGARRVMVAGAAVLGVSMLLLGTTRSLLELYLYVGVVGALGIVGLGWVPTGVLLSQWFSERRARVVGLAFSGMGVGVFVVGPLTQALITRVGWRGASAVLGAGALVALLPLLWLGLPRGPRLPGSPVGRSPTSATRARDATSDRGARAALRAAFASIAFWALFFAYFFTPLAVFPVFTHQVAFAVDLGFPRLLVAWMFGLMGLMSSAGRVGFGMIADRLGGPLAATLSFGCTAGGAVSLLLLERRPWLGWLVVYAVLFGLGFGARGPIITAMATERFGGPRFGVIYGVLNMANGLGAALGPWFGGAVYDVTGSYRIAFASAVLFAAVAAGCFWVARLGRPAQA